MRIKRRWENRHPSGITISIIPFLDGGSLLGLVEQCVAVWWRMFTADDYQAITTGIGFNLNHSVRFLLMSPEQTRLCRNKIGQSAWLQLSLQLCKAFRIDRSQITFAGYRFSDKDYVSMSDT